MEEDTMIEFGGVDVVAQRRPDDEHLRSALAVVFGIPEDRVLLIEDVSGYEKSAAADVVCLSSSVEGEFTCLLSIDIARCTLPYDTREQLLQRFCELLGTSFLVPDEDINPYVFWLYSAGAVSVKVGIDADALDRDRYLIVERMP
jgi:hypothetical protein